MHGLSSQALPVAAPATVLAVGAFLKNRACLLHGRDVLWSPVHGDLSVPDACAAMHDCLRVLISEASGRGWRIDTVAHDLHPDFPSTWAAIGLAHELRVPARPLQHHHAHLGVVMAEQGWDCADAVHGLALDGVGLGSDGTAWGGELLAARAGSFDRLAHLPPLPLPGGDAAAREPWRVAAAVLHQLGRGHEIVPRFAALVGEAAAAGVATLLQRDLRCPRSTGAGRWFDAAAAALRLAPVRQAEAEAAIALERCAEAWLARSALDAEPADDDLPSLAGSSVQAMRAVALVPPADDDLPALVGSLFDESDAGRGAARFHAALAAGLVRAAAQHGVTRLALTGGCFHNRVLSRDITQRCQALGIRTWRPETVDCGDAGLALGQAWLAAHALQQPDRQAILTREPMTCA
jgi:hydrogenase maturation protein HypF